MINNNIIYRREGDQVGAYCNGQQLGQMEPLSWVKSFFYDARYLNLNTQTVTCEDGSTVTLKNRDLKQVTAALEAYKTANPLWAEVDKMMNNFYPNGYGTPVPFDPKIELTDGEITIPTIQVAVSLSILNLENEAAEELEKHFCPNSSSSGIRYGHISFSSKGGHKWDRSLAFVEHIKTTMGETCRPEASPFAMLPFDLSASPSLACSHFKRAKMFIKDATFEGNRGRKERIVIVGTNLDKLLKDERAELKLDMLAAFAEESGCSFCAVSTKANWGLENVLPITLLTTNKYFARRF